MVAEGSESSSHLLSDGSLDVQLQVEAHPHHLFQLLQLSLHLRNFLSQLNE